MTYPEPSEAEVLGWTKSLSNWGRWGADDRLGTLNFITDDVRRRAATDGQAWIGRLMRPRDLATPRQDG